MWPLAAVSEEILHLVGSRVSVPVILSLTIGTCGGSGEAETDKVNINTLANVSPSHQNRKVLCLQWKCSFELNFQKVPKLLPAACCLVLVGQLGKLF